MAAPKGIRQPGSGRKKGTPNRQTLDIREKLARLKCDPVEVLARIALRQIPCGTCIDEKGKPTGKTKYRLPANTHAATCLGGGLVKCTCQGIGERVCESCFGTKWERVSVQDMGAAAGKLAKMVVPELKAIEVSGSVDLGIQDSVEAILEARKKRLSELAISPEKS